HISRDCPDANVSRGRSSNRFRARGRRGGRGKQPEAMMSAWMADAKKSSEWYLDTCASSHMCGDRSAFSGFQEVEPEPLLTAAGLSYITDMEL
uniref:Retrovirus-related Pol polyprotein from transposon TNT 1-94-like beta-barrel domain-containing protein n=1 Tax=Strigamia maritima TaxID=126957 RepID=T1IH72_STRMM